MTDRLKKASEVRLDAKALGKTESEVRQEKTMKAVRARRARMEGLRRTGAIDNTSSPNLEQNLEARLKRSVDNSTKAFKARKAVAEYQRRRDEA